MAEEERPKERGSSAVARQPLARAVTEANWPARLGLLAVVFIGAGIAWIGSTTVMPRWWAHRVADLVDGNATAGTLFGLLVGFVSALLTLVIARQALRRVSPGLRLTVLVAAVVAALPNLMTLSIGIGSSSGARAGEAILAENGPGFGTASAWGAGLGALVAVGLFAWTWKWRRDRRQLRSLGAQNATRAERAKRGDS